MSNAIKLKRGLDIRLTGSPQKKTVKLPITGTYALLPADFKGVTPKLLVGIGDTVKAGTPVFFDKYHPQVLFCSPVSGKVEAINRGEKRKILSVTIAADTEIAYEQFEVGPAGQLTREKAIELMLSAGLWPCIVKRPYGIIASADETPRDIFISGFDSAPLAPDTGYCLREERENVQAAIDVLRKLTPGKVYLGLDADAEKGVLDSIQGAEINYFRGPHPAGNVGVQIHHIAPIAKGDVVWTVDVQNLAVLGRFFRTGKVDFTKTIAVAGSEIADPQYYQVIAGAAIDSIIKGNVRPQAEGDSVRLINGNVLTGAKTSADGYLGFYNNLITAIPEGDKYEFAGWAMPRFKKFSTSRSYFSWICPRKRYALDTNLNGGERAFVMTGVYEKVLPMDIYPMYLFKACLAGDIDKMENLGIYEVVEEDVALCEFVCPSKSEIQQMVRQGIDLIIKELN